MFVSSYSTYIDTNRTSKSQESKKEQQISKEESSFAQKLNATPTKLHTQTLNLPINYVSNYKVLHNQQKLQQDMQQNMQKLKFSKMKTFTNAQVAYSDNTKMFSLLIKPRATLNQTPRIDKKMPLQAQEAKTSLMKHQMVNTYIANENYYRITA